MNDESSSTNTSETSLLKKITRIFSPNPTSSDEVADMLRSAENESIIDAGALQIMEGALKVSDLQAREIMIPRSQMKFIEADLSLEEILNIAKAGQHPRAFEVYSGLLKNMTEANDRLLKIQKEMREMEGIKKETNNTNIDKAIFVGSTSELSKLLKNNASKE